MPFESTGRGNQVLQAEGFYISYRPYGESIPELDALAELATLLTDKEYSNDLAETALVNHDANIGLNPYFILNGDYRKQYEPLVNKGWEACYQFWLSEVAKGHMSQWSHDPLEMDLPVSSIN